jgi:uncharacterized repeat protein (TIGR03803 family)
VRHKGNFGGYAPYGGVALASDGLLYGATISGSTSFGDFGTLYRVAPNGQSFATLYSFSGGADGAAPRDFKLTQASDGLLYGTTSKGGANGGGTLFRLDPATLMLTTLHAFNAPAAVEFNQGPGLVAGRDGFLYGTTFDGGANGFGSVFRFDPRTAAMTTLHDFAGPDGWFPVPGALMQGTDANFYGTTGGVGSVYKLNPATLTFPFLSPVRLHDLTTAPRRKPVRMATPPSGSGLAANPGARVKRSPGVRYLFAGAERNFDFFAGRILFTVLLAQPQALRFARMNQIQRLGISQRARCV